MQKIFFDSDLSLAKKSNIQLHQTAPLYAAPTFKNIKKQPAGLPFTCCLAFLEVGGAFMPISLTLVDVHGCGSTTNHPIPLRPGQGIHGDCITYLRKVDSEPPQHHHFIYCMKVKPPKQLTSP
jgi:hypothetical protein